MGSVAVAVADSTAPGLLRVLIRPILAPWLAGIGFSLISSEFLLETDHLAALASQS